MPGGSNEVVGVEWVAKLDAFRAELAKVPDIGGKEARTLVGQLDRQMKRAEKSARDAAKQTKGEWTSTFTFLEKGAKAAGFGEMTEKASALGQAVGALVDPVTVFVAGLAGAGATVAGTTLAMGALTAGLVEAGFAAADAQKKLRGFKDIGSDFYPAVPKETQKSLDALAASGTAIDAIFDRFVVTVGANVAPTVEKLTDAVVGAALTAEAWFEKWAKGRNLLKDFATVGIGSLIQLLVGPLAGALETPLIPLDAMLHGIEAVADYTGAKLPDSFETARASIDHAVDALGTAPKTITDAVVEWGSSMAGTAYDASGLADTLDDLIRKGRDHIATTEKATEALKNESKVAAEQQKILDAAKRAREEIAAALIESEAAQSKAQAEYDKTIAKIDEWAEALLAAGKIDQATEKDMAELRARARAELEKGLDAEADARRAAVQKAEDLVTASTANERTAYEQLAVDKERALREYLDAAKAAHLDESQIAKDAAAIQAAYAARAAKLQIKQAEDTAMKVAGYTSRGLDQIASAYEATYNHAEDAADRLQQQLVAGDAYYTAAQKKELQERIDAQRKAAAKAFAASKRARMAEAAINLASSIVAAWNDGLQTGGPAGPIVGAAFAGIAAAAGATQLGAIAAENPSFHIGGPIDLAPDEMNVTARSHEFMLNPTGRGMFGDEDLRRANAGVSPSGGTVVAVSVYRHTRQVQRWKADGLLMGDPISKAIAEGKQAGHRSNRA
jgi:hypothetical protein